MEDSKCSKCNCQRYKAQAGKEVCFFCSHSIGFHEIPFSNINTEEHPYGPCLECRCQFYKEEIPYKCVYCGHSQGFHRSWPTTSSRNFRNAGRPASESVTVKHLLLFEEESPNMLPKEGSVKWNNMMDKGLIKENFKISINDDIFNEFRNLFGIADQSTKFKLYSPTNGKPVKLNDEPSFGLIKSTISKANRRLYIGKYRGAPGSNFTEALFEGSNFDVPSQSMELNNEAARKDDGIEYETTRGIMEYFRFDPNTDPVEVTAHPPRGADLTGK
ncbi:hypothetical protein RhiirC2_171199 [Rhizophagus irregularis]|uniref:Uncharacterized protein n=1 Tax=Rhizophagus irregularis TaxID=588596 RepID=A0A2N1MLM5_9GLOM|nr:hypothetical protein RhiirC2_171199 [Rhizophagus irregularis]